MSSQQFKSKKFLSLQKKWYAKLEDVGFKEIEDVEHDRLKEWHSKGHFSFNKRENVERKELNEAYYSAAIDFSLAYDFKNEYEKEIWLLHSEGKSMRVIASIVNDNGGRTNKDYINRILSRLMMEFKKCL